MKGWSFAVFALGLSFAAPAFAHDDHDDRGYRDGREYRDERDYRAARAVRGGNPDLDHNGWIGPRDLHRIQREARREEVRRHFTARARAKHHMYHRARARAYAEDAREAAARARAHAARAHHW